MASHKRPEEQASNMLQVCPGCVGQGEHWTTCFKRQSGVYGGQQNTTKVSLTPTQPSGVQTFTSGATRSADDDKNSYVGFLSIPALEAFGDYMTRHRVQPDGSLREPDNWKKGIPLKSYLESLFRHVIELVGLRCGYVSRRLQKEYPENARVRDITLDTACAILFNIQGFLHEYLKEDTPPEIPQPQQTTGAADWADKFRDALKQPQAPLYPGVPPVLPPACPACGGVFGTHNGYCQRGINPWPTTSLN